MNENINLYEILKNCPKGTKFYSSIVGELIYTGMYISSTASKIYFIDPNSKSMVEDSSIKISYCIDGRFYNNKGECTLFPSRNQRDWSKWKCPKPKFDPKTLQPFDRVLGRNHSCHKWTCDLFSDIIDGNECIMYHCINSYYRYCIPYNDETKHLVGTTEEAPEYYRYWEE